MSEVTGSDTDVVPVVTAFLRNGGEVLLVRRSDAVGSSRGRWEAVSKPLEGDAEATARAGIREQTGLPREAVALVRAGEPFAVSGEARDRLVHPFLFDCGERTVDPDEGLDAAEWVPPTETLRRETAPGLWTAYDRVRPTPGTVARDTEHGSAYLSVRALEVLRDEAALARERDGDRPTPADVARELLAARPSMTALTVRVNRVMSENGETAAGVEAAATDGIRAALAADRAAAERVADLVDGETVLTLSRSGTVARALESAPEEVVVAESRPAREGVGTAERLAEAGVEVGVTLVTDAAVATVLARGDVDSVVVGADTVLRDGSIVNKTGTRGAALAAAREEVRLLVATAADKISPATEAILEAGPPEAVYDGQAPVAAENPTFDVTPADLVDGVVTEQGLLDVEEVVAVADRHAALADW
jgi:translation initiation factor 2B subunit (eIF-2B alpha/beta/delta family)